VALGLIGRGLARFSEEADVALGFVEVEEVHIVCVCAETDGCALGCGWEWARKAARKVERKGRWVGMVEDVLRPCLADLDAALCSLLPPLSLGWCWPRRFNHRLFDGRYVEWSPVSFVMDIAKSNPRKYFKLVFHLVMKMRIWF
jgi:hypothetical protein